MECVREQYIIDHVNKIYDRQLNNWLHDYLYKKFYTDEVGKTLRKMYETGEIRKENEFEEALKNVLSNCKK